MTGPQNLPRRDQHCFVPRPADLEVDFMLAFKLDFAVVEAPGGAHQPVHSNEIVRLESVVLGGVEGAGLGVRLHSHAASPLLANYRRKFIITEAYTQTFGRLHENHTGK